MKTGHVDVITMGCSKNLVDSESLMRQFEATTARTTRSILLERLLLSILVAL